MREKIVEILVILMDKIKRKELVSGQMELLSGELMDQGYSEQEISNAFSWLIERADSTARMSPPGSSSFRILNEIERVFISREAHGYLLQLAALELITPEELEGIIDRALMFASPSLSVDEIKHLTAEVLFETNGSYNLRGDNYLPNETVH